LLAPTAFNAGKGEKRGDASFVNNTIKGSLTCQSTCLLRWAAPTPLTAFRGSARP